MDCVPNDIISCAGNAQKGGLTTQVTDSQQALQEYCNRFCERGQKQYFGFHCKSFPWAVDKAILPTSDNQDEVQEELEKELIVQQEPLQRTRKSPHHNLQIFHEDSDGDDVRLCQKCDLPVGEVYYRRGRHLVHGECMAQFMAEDIRGRDEERTRESDTVRDRQHAAYGIGWDVEQIPRNREAASKLAMRDVSEGMLCVVAEDGKSIRLGSTLEVAGAINLEYLSTALKVRRAEGSEPVFSLDPVDPMDLNTMQAKKFSPEWLANTKAGEVLFQADYHLKELSMGVFHQPVIGMKSCYERAFLKDHSSWHAREWFVVRKAEVLVSESNMLIPVVRMGVEAREQVLSGTEFVDKAVTKQNHPMLQYATEFTRNFDLIAERKSVIYHLRELAKASVMAKYLIESGSTLEESWFHLTTFGDEACCLEVPQLWHERICSEVQVQNGTVAQEFCGKRNSVFGGVRFGLEKFSLGGRLGAPSATLSASTGRLFGAHGAALSVPAGRSVRPSATLSASKVLGVPSARLPSATLSASKVLGVPSARLPFAGRLTGELAAGLSTIIPTRIASSRSPRFSTTSLSGAFSRLPSSFMQPSAALSSVAKLSPSNLARMPFRQTLIPTFAQAGVVLPSGQVTEPLKGVDLRLDQFDLTEAKRVTLEATVGSWGDQVKSLDECVSIGSAFFSALDGSEAIFKDGDLALLKDVFNPMLSDRRHEGDTFIPPDASFSYVNRLRHLTKDEELYRQRRKDHFLSTAFTIIHPGSLFPDSWTPSSAIATGETSTPESHAQGHLRAHPEYKTHWALLRQQLNRSAPVFDKCTEEGRRFRIYRTGKLEVRTLRDVEGDEELGMVFSMCNGASDTSSHVHAIDECEKIVKATEYVEREFSSDEERSKPRCRYYLVCETEKDHKIVMERPADNRLTWAENPLDLEVRTSFGKVTRSQEASADVTVQHMKALQADATRVSLSDKRFIQAAFLRAVGPKGVQLSKLFPPSRPPPVTEWAR